MFTKTLHGVYTGKTHMSQIVSTKTAFVNHIRLYEGSEIHGCREFLFQLPTILGRNSFPRPSMHGISWNILYAYININPLNTILALDAPFLIGNAKLRRSFRGTIGASPPRRSIASGAIHGMQSRGNSLALGQTLAPSIWSLHNLGLTK